MSEADKWILRDTTDYRVANFAGGNPFVDGTNATAYYHRSVGGYHAATLRRYDELITHHLAKNNMAVYDMLNTRYFIVPGASDGGGATTQVEVNTNACGSAWYVDTIRWVNSPDQELLALHDFDPHTTAVVDSSKFNDIAVVEATSDTAAKITLVEYRTNRLTYRTRSAVDGVVVFSEIYYPKGWTAYLDGELCSYFRANYVLRAMEVPAGEHEIVFSFRAPYFSELVWVTRICSLILLLGALGLVTPMVIKGVKAWQGREA
jgi:hypothetical protein